LKGWQAHNSFFLLTGGDIAYENTGKVRSGSGPASTSKKESPESVLAVI